MGWSFSIRFLFFYILALLIASQALLAADSFDEVYGQSKSEVRPVYRGIIDKYDALTGKQKKRLAKQTLKEFEGDNALLPLPRVLSEREMETLRKGVIQRAKTLHAFLTDHYSGEKNYLKAGVIPQMVIERILKRSREEDWAQYIDVDNLNFWYGPDVIRGPPETGFPEGRFYVVEDNSSFIGGVGDLKQARKTLNNIMPEYNHILKSPKATRFYKRIAKRYKKEAKKYGGVAVAVQYISDYAADNEDKRVASLMEKQGIHVVMIDPYKRANTWRKGKRIIVDGKKAWLEIKKKNGKVKRKRIGYIVTNMNPQEMELSHAGNKKYHIFEEATLELEQKGLKKSYRKKLKKLLIPDEKTGEIDYKRLAKLIKNESPYKTNLGKKLGLVGITDLIVEGRMGITNGPGMEFLGDKEFYLYVEALIDFYLGEAPIIKNMKTQSFARFEKNGTSALDEKAMRHVFKNLKKYVIKGVDGRGGDAVWVGPKIVGSDEIANLKNKIRENPGRYIFQAYTPLSTIAGNIGDLRIISDVNSSGVIVADVPWARVVSLQGDGKVNISANGYEATVMIKKSVKQSRCRKLLFKILSAK